jgi:hypothetical protein
MSYPAQEILKELQQWGIDVALSANGKLVYDRTRLPRATWEVIAKHEQEIVEILAGERLPNGARVRRDGRGHPWANAHRKELGNQFFLNDIDAFSGSPRTCQSRR